MLKKSCKLWWHLAAFLIITLLIAGCITDNGLAGTAGSETVNTYTLLVVDTAQRPVSNASVRLVANNSWLHKKCMGEELVYYAARTGSDGSISIPSDTFPQELCNLLVQSECLGAYITSYQLRESADTAADVIMVKKSGVLTGTVQGIGAAPSRVLLQGTDLSSSIDPQTGGFSFGVVPAGLYTIIITDTSENDDGKRLTGVGEVHISENATARKELTADFSGVIVDDFDGMLPVMSYLRSGEWYIVKNGDVSVSFPLERSDDTLYIPFQSALVSSGAYSGNSLKLNYRTGTGTYFLIVGAQVGSRDAGVINVDTLSFKAKGNGTVTIRFHGEEDRDKPQAMHKVTLDTSWQQYTVTWDQYTVIDPQNSSASWSDVEGRMSWISFLPGADGTEFWLDEVRIEGITMQELILP